MNILQVCLSNVWGGLESYILSLTEYLQKKGNNVVLLTRRNSPLDQKVNKEGIIYFSFQSVVDYVDLSVIWQIKKIISKLKIEIIHLHRSADLWLVVPASKLSGENPYLIFTNHIISTYPKKDFLHSLLYHELDWIISDTEIGRKAMLSSCPIEEKNTKVMAHGIKLDRFDPKKYNSDRVRNSLGIPHDSTVIGIIGRIEVQKGQKEFLLAAKEVVKDFPNIYFLIVGMPNKGQEGYEVELRKIASDSLLKDKIIFTGFREDIPEILSALDVFVLASYGENLGSALLEAMAMGKAVIGTNAGGIPEIIEDKKDGLLVPPRDYVALSQAMRNILQDKNVCNLLGINAQEKVKENFSLAEHLKEIEFFYFNLLKNDGKNITKMD